MADRRRHRPGHRAQDPDDGDAAAGRGVSQPRRHGGGAGRRGGLSQPGSVRDRGADHADRQPVDHQHPAGQPDRDGPRRRHRRDHLLGLGDRLPQAQRQHVGQADPAAAAARDQPRHAGRDPRADRLLHPGPGAVGLLHGHGAELRDRLPADHPDRRRRHAGRDLDAQQLFGLGRGGDGLHAAQQRDDHHRRAGRKLGRDPQLHHVPGDEPQLHLGHRRRLRRRSPAAATRRRSTGRTSAARPRTRPS